MVTVLVDNLVFGNQNLVTDWIRTHDHYLTVDGIAMAISRMAPSHFLWKKPYKCWDTVSQLCRLRLINLIGHDPACFVFYENHALLVAHCISIVSIVFEHTTITLKDECSNHSATSAA